MYIHVPARLARDDGVFDRCIFELRVAPCSAIPWRCVGQGCGTIGAAFTLIALLTGSLWGKPMWGTYWVWDRG